MPSKRTRPTSRQQGSIPKRATAARARASLDRLSPQQRGAITRAANKAGKDPARVFAGLRAAETRQRNERKAARDAQRRERLREEKTRTRSRSAKTERPDAHGRHRPAKSRKRAVSKRPTKAHGRRKKAPRRTGSRAPAQRSEYAVSADYKRARVGKAITIQIAAIGPKNATKQDAIDAVNYKIDHNASPRGWNVKIINWRGGEWRGEPIDNDAKKQEAWRTLSAPIALADLDVSKVGRN